MKKIILFCSALLVLVVYSCQENPSANNPVKEGGSQSNNDEADSAKKLNGYKEENAASNLNDGSKDSASVNAATQTPKTNKK